VDTSHMEPATCQLERMTTRSAAEIENRRAGGGPEKRDDVPHLSQGLVRSAQHAEQKALQVLPKRIVFEPVIHGRWLWRPWGGVARSSHTGLRPQTKMCRRPATIGP